ncbi:MAG: hypothetical protein ABII09_07990 [Planctomycetota bacterium]
MDTLRPERVSVIEPIGPAIERVRLMLFRPFDLSKWFIIGFCAWLAQLGQGGWPNFNFNFSDRHHRINNCASGLGEVKDAIGAHLPWIILGAAIIIPIVIVLWLVFSWLRSRGQFMFVHCLAGNSAEVVVPWKKFAGHGNSLFLFRIVLGLINILALGLPVALMIITIIAMASSGPGAAAVSGLIVAIFAVIFVAILFSLIAKFTTDFVVPIMFLQTSSALAGWRGLLSLIGCNKARMALYILFKIVISLVIGIIAATICLVGCCCCCASVLLLVPYVGTVILLPLIAFTRAYSLFYLRQFGAQFDVFSGQAS